MRPALPLLLSLALLAGCATPAVRADAPTETRTGTHVDPGAPKGAIGGRIQFPAGVAPAMRICALSSAASRCIDIPAGRTLYRIGQLPDGEYRLLASVDSAVYTVAAHVQAVQCIRAPCLDQPVTLAIAGGKDIADADLNGFYAERADFPPLPPE